MTQTLKACTRDLAIQVQGPTHFAPGDTIHGTVDRATHIVTPQAIVTLTLHGRAKATVSPSDRNDATDYRSDFRLFDTRRTTLKLFDGPLHIEKGGEPAAWPFVIDIPLFVEPGVGRRSGEPQEVSYEPLDNAERPLPESFTISESGFSSSVNAHVEYYLEAKLAIFHNGWGKAKDATFPIMLRYPRPEPPIANFEVKPHRLFKMDKFLSQRLVPGCEDMRLSSSQKVKRFFHSRDVPCLAIEYDVKVPGVIQIDNPTPVPFFLRARPRWDLTSEILQDVPQKIRIDSVRAEVISYTEAMAMGSFHAHTAEGDSKVTLGRYTWTDGPPAYLPFMPDDPPLNVGELMNLRVGYGRRFGTGLSGRIYADFTAFSIKHNRHQLRWNVTVSIAGEEGEVNIIKPVKILPAGGAGGPDEAPPPFVASRTESWVRPPPEGEAPPAYDHTDKAQGAAAGGSSSGG